MRKFLLSILANTVICATAVAQMTIDGKVVEINTAKPVIAASVFISNSSTGTATDNAGNFSLNKIPAGKFTLVVSSIGYETFVKDFQANAASAAIIIELRHKAAGLGEVVVTPQDKNGWINWGDLFIEYFIGTSSYARTCRIKNPEVLKFRRNYKDSSLSVSAEAPLVIENKSLGYIIKYNLKEFKYYFSNNTVRYSGYPLFEELIDNDNKASVKYGEARMKVYAVSLLHFIRSLYNETVSEAGFRVLRRTGNKIVELKNSAPVTPREYTGLEKYDTIYEISNTNTSIKIMALENSDVKKNDLNAADKSSFNSILVHSNDGNVLLNFTDSLQVIYTKGNAPFEYMKYAAGSHTGSTIISEISLGKNEPVAIMANGSFAPANLVMNGFWGWWEKISIMLPYDYLPPVGAD